ncbi:MULTISPECIES: ABC transporter substrate-binding protein [Acinetobacter]|jgi:NitT/TauT family transport system substrate-binding protein|uniref:ABC transporter substrate-binding protein n=1 Tax=Acinetobacter TaxID=469 RepID=UPI0025B414A3|nr:ABC transporter substrate-binding protein [Acinetobacter pittii]MDN4022425.1 ABC transporter substrate-binding protein [Acinetobacter pittii]
MFKAKSILFSVLASTLLVACDSGNKANLPSETSNASATEMSQKIKIGYSDYPGWVAWQIAIDKGWFKEQGLDVDFEWFDYSASLNAFSSKQIDAVTIAHGDNLMVAASGVNGILVLATDLGKTNDLIIAKQGIELKDLKGKKIAVEKGLVDHLLLDSALKDLNIKSNEVELVNTTTNEIPQVFTSPDVQVAALWQPSANQALKNVPGSKIIYSAENKPGIIFGALTVNSESLLRNQKEWKKIIQIWDRVVAYIEDPKTHDEAIQIMANKAGVPVEQYREYVDGTDFLNVKANQDVFNKSDKLTSIYGSSYHVNEFNIEQGAYSKKLDVDSLISPVLLTP